MRTIESGPFVYTATSEDRARSIADQFIGKDTNDYSLTYDETNRILRLYDETLDGILVLIVNVKGE